jgi:hypothetical protein
MGVREEVRDLGVADSAMGVQDFTEEDVDMVEVEDKWADEATEVVGVDFSREIGKVDGDMEDTIVQAAAEIN